MSSKKRLSFWWKFSALISPRQRLLMGFFSDQFLFRVSEDLWIFGRYRLENESRYFAYAVEGMANRKFEISGQRVTEKDEAELRAYVETLWEHFGPLRAA